LQLQQNPRTVSCAIAACLGVSSQELTQASETISETQKRYDEAQERHNEAQQQSNMIIMQLTKQLEKQTLLLEDIKDRSIWRRVKTACALKKTQVFPVLTDRFGKD